MATWIYFFWNTKERFVKIGQTSNDPLKRLKQLQHNPGSRENNPLKMICAVRGAAADETKMHSYFAAEHIDKESFEPSPRLKDYIRWLCDQFYVALPTMSARERDDCEMLPSNVWMPNAENRKSQPTASIPFEEWPDDLGYRETTADDFYTNEIIIEAARKVLGHIDLDPASHVLANSKVRADKFYTIADDGLSKPWHGRVWLNPPFSQWGRWVPKILAEIESGRVESLCVLSAMRTVTAKYFAPLLEASQSLCIMHGRIRFWGEKAGDSPDDGHCVFYFGDEVAKFEREFSVLGTCFQTAKCAYRARECVTLAVG